MQRMYGARDFEFVSINTDGLKKKDKVIAFLKEKNAATKNYIFSSDDKYALIEAVDKNWPGALPYTVLVAPGGEIVYASRGRNRCHGVEEGDHEENRKIFCR